VRVVTRSRGHAEHRALSVYVEAARHTGAPRYSIESVHLPVYPPVLPMLSKRVENLPGGDDWIFEPKWDGFRAIVFRDGDETYIQSRDAKPLNRYFPELLAPLQAQLPARCVLDGEVVIAKDGGLDFEALQLRLHPAASRVKLLSQQIPASVVFFDLLCLGDRAAGGRMLRGAGERRCR
jgi:ATP-dependent DNA ligase